VIVCKNTCKILEDLQQRANTLCSLSQHSRLKATCFANCRKEQVLHKQLKRIEGFTSIYQDDIDQTPGCSNGKKQDAAENLVASQALYQIGGQLPIFARAGGRALAALRALEKQPASPMWFKKVTKLLVTKAGTNIPDAMGSAARLLRERLSA
jgi:hypothetical protein